jgi:hypothetical protein
MTAMAAGSKKALKLNGLAPRRHRHASVARGK